MRIVVSWLMLLLFLLFPFWSLAQVYTEQDIQIYNKKIKLAEKLNLHNKPIHQVVETIAKSLMGKSYEANALEKPDKEELVVHLKGLDCLTFVENVLAVSINIKQKSDFKNYTDNLKKIRYRNGVIKNYTSRLHYFSDWIYDNVQKKTVEDVTQKMGGEPIRFHVGFMSQNPEKYPVLKTHPEFVSAITNQELEINRRKYFYIPKSKIKIIECCLQSGDLLAITTNKKGIDIAHVGIAVREPDGKVYLLNASSQYKRVQISKLTLSQYLENIQSDTGIMVLRLNEK